MPSPEHVEYNPNIIGFVSDIGPVVIKLNTARKRYGELPSEYKLVPEKEGRQKKKGLNLALGKLVTETLKRDENTFKKIIYDFYQAWHRDYRKEFGIHIVPFVNLNDPAQLKKVLENSRGELADSASLELRPYLTKKNLIRKDVLNSIKDDDLPVISERILEKKIRNLPQGKKSDFVNESLHRIKAARIIKRIQNQTFLNILEADRGILNIFADEIAREMINISKHVPLAGTEKIIGVRGQGVEVEFAERDTSYLMLGKETGDCTSDKSHYQADTDVENIYWTVFPWMLDRNYQIMKVFYDNEFVMKVHLLPLFLTHDGVGEIVLAVDAIETVRALRDDLEQYKKDTLLEHREVIFNRVIEEIEQLGDRMGIHRIYAEKFSNTNWVRERFDSFQEIFLHVDSLIKLDELEDIYSLSLELGRRMDMSPPGEIFMEIQMKNTSLQPLVTHRTAGIKPYAVIRGNPDDGIPMKKVMGV